MIEFDIVLDKIGHLGRYQIMLCALTYWLGIPSGLHNLASVFYAPPIDYRCNVPPIDNATVYPNLNESDILNLTTPYKSGKYDTCERYGYDLSECDGTFDCVNKSSPAIKCDMGYWFDTTEFTSTIDTTWGMICDEKIISTAVTAFYFAGMWAGAIVFGYTSDLYGRRITMFLTNIGALVFGIATAFAPYFWLFAILRFFVAMFSHGSFLSMTVYVIEISGNKRTPTGIHAHTAFAVGYILASLFSYFLRDWRYFYLGISLTPIPYIFFHFLVPESPRWHFSNLRDDEGKELSHKFAKHNKKEIHNDVWEEAETGDVNKESLERKYAVTDLFKQPRMRLITCNVMFSWFVISLMYYGLSLNAGSLSGNIFLNNALNGVMEIFGYFIVVALMDRIGRRILLSGAYLLGGCACIGSMLCAQFADGNQAVITTGVTMAFIGKIGAGAGFGIIYNYTAELYPTVVRVNGLGVGSMAARWGSILSPFVILAQDYIPWFPSALFGFFGIIAGFLALLYPETNKKRMPQTLEEAELFYKGLLEEINEEKDDLSDISTVSGCENVSYQDYEEEKTDVLPGINSTKL
uniref:organic cation transporter protein-like n=1 Tax=Styela clava TaxID=7725 RepID=UPI00193AA85D|nr:organic cation transporter protein-like [Styela clava]